MKKLFFILFASILLFSCQRRHHVAKQKVQCYKQHVVHDDGSANWIFWYILWTSNNQSCYYYSSSTPISNYSSVIWVESKENPLESINENDIQQMPEQEVSQQELSSEMQQEIDTNPEDFGGMTQDEMGDYEGGGSDNSSDGGSGESGGDFGGGDSGGGDGGGGE